ncbi:MAG: aspartate dehydrogenase [Candidatus Goldiibacteriota bacterium]
MAKNTNKSKKEIKPAFLHKRAKRKKKLGIIGCGAIGREIAGAIDKGDIDVNFYGCHDLKKENFNVLAGKLKNIRKPRFFDTNTELIKKCDLIVECASKDSVKEIFEKIIKFEKDVMFLSVGGVLANMDLFEEAKEKMIDVYIPSGAVIGLDGLEAAKYKGLKKVTLVTRKPPAGFKGVKYLKDRNIDVDSIKTETVVFDGNARDAVEDFPANINVAATLSIAGIGAKDTNVKIIIDPFTRVNIHEIIVEGEFGRFKAITENMPSPNNPKTSYLTALSTIVMLKGIVEPIHIGT